MAVEAAPKAQVFSLKAPLLSSGPEQTSRSPRPTC